MAPSVAATTTLILALDPFYAQGAAVPFPWPSGQLCTPSWRAGQLRSRARFRYHVRWNPLLSLVPAGSAAGSLGGVGAFALGGPIAGPMAHARAIECLSLTGGVGRLPDLCPS